MTGKTVASGMDGCGLSTTPSLQKGGRRTIVKEKNLSGTKKGIHVFGVPSNERQISGQLSRVEEVTLTDTVVSCTSKEVP